MPANYEATVVHPFTEETPFAYGEQTVLQMRAQTFEVQDELGTVVAMPIDTNVRRPLETVFSDQDAVARLERKLDLALRHIEKLQQRIESIDMTLARTLSR